MLSFRPVEEFIVAKHPDPDSGRQKKAVTRGAIVSPVHVAEVLGSTRERVLFWRRVGLTIDEADRLAIKRLGVHPSDPQLWGLDWAAHLEMAAS